MKLQFAYRVAGYIIAGILLCLAWLNLDMWRVAGAAYSRMGYDIPMPFCWRAFILLSLALATLLLVPALIPKRHIGPTILSFRFLIATLLLLVPHTNPFGWNYFVCHHDFSHAYFHTCGEHLQLTENTLIAGVVHSLLPLIAVCVQRIKKRPNKAIHVIAA